MDYSLDLGGNFAAKAREDLAAAKELKGGIDEATAALGRFGDKAKASPAAVVPPSAAAPAATAPDAPRGPGRPRKEVSPEVEAERAAKAEAKARAKADAAAQAAAAKAQAAATAAAVGVETAEFKFMRETKAAADLAALKGKQAKTEAYYAKVRAAEGDAAKASDKAHAKKTSNTAAQSAQLSGLAKTAALAGGAALGVAGAGGLARLALGYKGMMQLQGVSYRLGLSFRQLFSGVNPAPVIRAANAFAEQFKKTSVLGHALEGLFTRSFGTLFAGVEKATPYAIAFVQGITLGFLTAENAILRARLAFAPYSLALEEATGDTDGLTIAAELGGIALAALAVKATVAAAPFLPYALAIGAVVAALDQLNKISKEWDENSGAQIIAKLKKDVGLGGDAAPRGVVTGADYDKQLAAAKAKATPAAAANGAETGKQIAAGLVKGMDAGAADVTAAGGRLAQAADAGVKAKAKIKSPSRLMEQNALYMGDGAIRGLDKSGPGVQAAAERNLVPDVAGMGGAGGGARGAGGGNITLQINSPLVQVMAGGGADIEARIMAAAPRLLDEVMRRLALQLGVSVRP